MGVVQNRVPALFIGKEAQQSGVRPVAPVIAAAHQKARLVQRFGGPVVPVDIFRHAVNDLNDGLRC